MLTWTHRNILVVALIPMLVSCQSQLSAKNPKITKELRSYQCKNDIEIQCNSSNCKSKSKNFTPMDVSFDTDGKLSVCAYSGCWQGKVDVLSTDNFLMLKGSNLKFSTSDLVQNIALTLDLSDNVAMIKAGGFSQPLLCEISK